VRPGDAFDVRGPIGGYFIWEPEHGGPLLLVGGGSGIVPLRAMLRHRRRSRSEIPARLLLSARTRADVIYREELEQPDGTVEVALTLTRAQPPGWTGYSRRVDTDLLRETAWPVSERPLAFVCGPTPFVEAVATSLVELGYDPGRVKTERFGATGRP
jgi:NAD(P)H-flavin reductase